MHERILIVEDELYTAKALSRFLKNLDYSPVGIATSGEDALEKAGVLSPDLILMDIVLDGKMDGIEAAQQIKARIDVPISLIPLVAPTTPLERAKKTEPSGYLTKPITSGDEIYPTIEIALGNFALQQTRKNGKKDGIINHLGETSDISTKGSKINSKLEIEIMDLLPVFEALSNKERLKIFEYLREDALIFQDLMEHLDKSQATVSHHLKILEKASLIQGIRQGKFSKYHLTDWSKQILLRIHNKDVSILSLKEIFSALANHERLSIIKMLGEREHIAKEFEEALHKSQSTISHHLRILAKQGLIQSIMQGKTNLYKLNSEKMSIFGFFA